LNRHAATAIQKDFSHAGYRAQFLGIPSLLPDYQTITDPVTSAFIFSSSLFKRRNDIF
jgi:hypothetical protein